MSLLDLEVGFGGAAAGGKSAAILLAALQFVEWPGYHALIIRRTFSDLSKPGALMPLSHEWLAGTPAAWNEQKHQWRFPSGATLNFGYCENSRDVYQFQGSNFSYVAFDELTQFEEFPYTYLFSRMRKREGDEIPLRMRATFNPGGIGHDWVKARFVLGSDGINRTFIPANIDDNPSINKATYEQSLAQLDPVTRAQLRHGDWNIRPEGNLFKRAWFDVVTNPPAMTRIVRGWDFAATEEGTGADPDWTAGCKIGLGVDGNYYILHALRTRDDPGNVERLFKNTAVSDGYDVSVRIPQDPGSAGKALAFRFCREILSGYDCRADPVTGDKVTRALPASAACERRQVKILRGQWNHEFLDELCAFPSDGHDDQVDAFTTAFQGLQTVVSMAGSFSPVVT